MTLIFLRFAVFFHSHHGDLTAKNDEEPMVVNHASMIVHNVELKHASNDNGRGYGSDLGDRLDLGVGGCGVIGRMLSVTSGGREIGHGVIGWN